MWVKPVDASVQVVEQVWTCQCSACDWTGQGRRLADYFTVEQSRLIGTVDYENIPDWVKGAKG